MVVLIEVVLQRVSCQRNPPVRLDLLARPVDVGVDILHRHSRPLIFIDIWNGSTLCMRCRLAVNNTAGLLADVEGVSQGPVLFEDISAGASICMRCRLAAENTAGMLTR